MKKKFALFDFDNTIINGDSMKYLLRYYISKHPLSVFRLFNTVFLFVLYKLNMCSFIKVKESILFPLNNMSDNELEVFFKEKVEKYYYDNVVNELIKQKEKGYTIILCTASVEAYMKYCKLPIDVLIGTQTKRINNHETNIITSKNCKSEEKVLRINEYLKENNLEIDYDNSWGYSDSKSDFPMLNMVKNKIRIELKTGNMKKW